MLKNKSYIFAIFIGKLISISTVFYFPYKKINNITFLATDSASYLSGAKNFIDGLGTYRLPAYPLFIKIFLLISDSKYNQLIIITQLFIGLLSCYLFYFILLEFTNKKLALFLSIIFSLNPYLAFYDLRIMTETSCTFLLLLGLYFLLKSLKSQKYMGYFLSGLSFSVLPFLKAIYFPFIALTLLFVIIYNFKKEFLIKAACFISAFILFETAWVSFNYYRFKEVHLISKTSNYEASYEDLWNYFGTIWLASGVDFPDENNIAALKPRPIVFDIFPFPEAKFRAPYGPKDIETSEFNEDQLNVLQKERETVPFLFSTSFESDSTLTKQQKQKIKANKHVVFNRINRMVESIKKEHPIKSYVLARISLYGIYVSQDLNYDKYAQEVEFYPYENRGWYDFAMKLNWNTWFSFTLIFGFLGSIVCLFNKSVIKIFFGVISLYLFFIYPLIWIPEWRYFVACIPLFLLNVGIATDSVLKKFNS